MPALWLAPELLGAGDGGARQAQTGTSNPAESLGWAALLPLAVAWPLALAALRERAARLLAVGALAWIAVVAAMTVAGFAGLPRFVAPAAAVVCVLGGAGLAALVARPRAALVALVLPALVVTALGIRDRINEVPHAWRSSARIDRSHERLSALLPQVGREGLFACGRPATSDALVRTALAWQLDVPLSEVVSFGEPPRLSGAFVVGPQASPQLRARCRRRDARRAARRVAPLLAPLPGDRACRRRAPQQEVGSDPVPGGSPERALERVARPLSETLLARSVELASQALLLLLVPRALGSADYGSFAAAFAAMSVVSIGFGLGAPLAAMRYVPGADPSSAPASRGPSRGMLRRPRPCARGADHACGPAGVRRARRERPRLSRRSASPAGSASRRASPPSSPSRSSARACGTRASCSRTCSSCSRRSPATPRWGRPERSSAWPSRRR